MGAPAGVHPLSIVGARQQPVRAFTAYWGHSGDVRRPAQQRGIRRPRGDREATQVLATWAEQPYRAANVRLRQPVRDARRIR
jgi:hypothetical protein